MFRDLLDQIATLQMRVAVLEKGSCCESSTMSWSMPDGVKESDLDVGKVESVEVAVAHVEKGSFQRAVAYTIA